MLCGLQQGEKNPQISHQSNPRLGLHNVLVSDQCKIQSSNTPQTFTISSKKKETFSHLLEKQTISFPWHCSFEDHWFLSLLLLCFFFYYSNTKYFLHYQFSHFKASIVKQHTLQEPLTLPYKHLQMNTFKPASTSVTTAIKEKCK